MKYTIFAPHVDDEVIGCYSLLKEKNIKVVYFSELSLIRKKEALNASRAFQFKFSFSGYNYKPAQDEILVVPCKEDLHPEHRKVNAFAKSFSNKKLYYTTDKNVAYCVLPENAVTIKKMLMNRLYPSQAKLWENDDKYILFERIKETDYALIAKVTHQFPYIHYWNKAKNYLQNAHRHLFYITLMVEQFHNDRDIEFIALKEELAELCSEKYQIVSKGSPISCEMIGEQIREHFLKRFNYTRTVTVQVMEDNENGMVLI